MFDIIRYSSEKSREWDDFVAHSKNATFMLQRPYMDYHKDRFHDHSLMFYLKGKLYALVAANESASTFYAHQGLTFGGIIMNEKCTASLVLTLFEEMNAYLAQHGFTKVVYKPIPHIYHRLPAEEDLYALFRCNAQLIARGASTTIDLASPLKWRQNRRTALNKAMSEGITVEESREIGDFWTILDTNLVERHNLHPVHTKEEMELLMNLHPRNIKLLQARNSEGKVIGGILFYITEQVIHSQYISANAEGKQNGAIDAIMHEALNENGILRKGIPAQLFDFGISTENGGLYLNESLIFQKEGFGGRTTCYDVYEYPIS